MKQKTKDKLYKIANKNGVEIIDYDKFKKLIVNIYFMIFSNVMLLIVLIIINLL